MFPVVRTVMNFLYYPSHHLPTRAAVHRPILVMISLGSCPGAIYPGEGHMDAKRLRRSAHASRPFFTGTSSSRVLIL